MNEVEQYIANFEPEVQERLYALRQLFYELKPDVTESISYKIPAYKLGKHSLYFAAYKNHIGFYPVYGLDGMEEEIRPYRAKSAKHSLHFPHNKPLPLELVKAIIVEKSK